MKEYAVTVRFSGAIEYVVKAENEEEAKEKAEELASEETRLGALEDIDYEAVSSYF